MSNSLLQKINELSISQPNKTAIAYKDETLSYSELFSRISKVGSRIAEIGIRKGDRVLFSAVSKPEMVIVYLAIQSRRGVPVFIDKNSTVANVISIYRDAGARLFFTDRSAERYGSECNVYSLKKICTESGKSIIDFVDPADDEIAELIYTSGTTGQPKGCVLTYKAVYNILMNTIKGVGVKNDDTTLIPLPLHHSFALRVLRANLYAGATVVLQNGFTFAKEIENNINKYKCTSIAIVPASVETIEKQMQDKFSEIMGRFKYIEVSAGSLSIAQRKKLVNNLPKTTIHNTWGSSESGGAIFLNVTDVVKNHPDKISALGKPLENVKVSTINENGDFFESNKLHPGRMCIRGNMQMMGYWNNHQLTEETIKNGWLITNDIVYIDKDGFLYMLGRADDIINVGGEKVSPIEIENTASEYPYISECACIGVEDPNRILGFVPILFVVSKNNKYTEDDFRIFLSQRLEKNKIPVKLIQLLELPRNSMQKIDRKALKNIWENYDSQIVYNSVIETLMTRRSVRKFKEDKIDKKLLQTIVKAGYYAPSGHNMQTWRFFVITDKEEINQLKAKTKEAAESNNEYFYGWENPSVVILITNDKRNMNGCQDASCAAENIMLAAWSYGIGSVWLNALHSLRDKEPVKELLDKYGVPENHIIWSTIAMGYPLSESSILKKNQNVISWIE